MRKVLVVGINGSPSKEGTTSKILRDFLSNVKSHGGDTRLIHLANMKINPCLGCYSRNPKLCRYPCRQKDDMHGIYPLLEKANAIVLATPVYWFNMSGLMKNFIDRLTCMAVEGYVLEGKVGVFISSSKENEGGRVSAVTSMAAAMNHLGLLIPPYSMLFHPGKEEVVKKGKKVWDDWASRDSKTIAKNLIKLCDFLGDSGFEW